MTKRQFEKMLTPDLLAKLRRIAMGVLRNQAATEDAVQTGLLRVFRRLKRLKKITPSYLATAVVGACRHTRQTRASNASREVPIGLPGDDAFQAAERAERERAYGRRVPARWGRDGVVPDPVDGPTDLWRG